MARKTFLDFLIRLAGLTAAIIAGSLVLTLGGTWILKIGFDKDVRFFDLLMVPVVILLFYSFFSFTNQTPSSYGFDFNFFSNDKMRLKIYGDALQHKIPASAAAGLLAAILMVAGGFLITRRG